MTLVDSFVEVKLADQASFLKIKETLTRIGVASKKEPKELFQSCHILHKQGKYYLVHFKELFALDGKDTDFSEGDIARRNTIAALLEEWGLFKVVDPQKIVSPRATLEHIKVITFKDKSSWILSPKYSIGKVKGNRSNAVNE